MKRHDDCGCGKHNSDNTSLPGFGGNMRQPQFVPVEFGQHLRSIMHERIEKTGDEYVVKTKSGDRVLGRHKTKKAALKQLAAIEISKHKK